jgi:arabinoxylan arabinofuranohydrolase
MRLFLLHMRNNLMKESMNRNVVAILIGLCASLLYAQNPAFPTGLYIADPSAHVWPDGKLYVYGSLVEFKGQWYVFYHRSSHGVMMMRRTCIEPIHFNADGSISEVEMTSQGAAGSLDAFSRIEVERACLLYGNVRLQAFASDNEMLTGIVKGDKAVYKYINFGQGAASCTMRIAPGAVAGKIDIALDNSWAPSISTIQITGDGDGKTWTTSSCNIKETKGVHAVWLRFNATSGASFNVDWFQFNAKNGSH